SSDVTILLGNGQGGFSPVSSPATDTYPYSIAAGDFNGDGIPDLAVANYFGFDVTILLGNGDGTFTAAPTPAAGVYPDSIAVGDFNGDGKQDLAVVNAYSKNITILLGDGKGDFTATAESPAAGNNPDSVTIADFNNDGIEDLAVANSNDNTVIVYYGKGDGTFPAATAQTVQLPSGTAPYSVTAFNYMANGFENFLVAGSGNNSVVLGQNTITTITNATLTRVKVPGAGTHNVQANYAGGSAYGASTSNTVGVAGTPIATTTTVTVEPSGTVAPGETVQLTAAVSPGSVGSLTPTGNMSFYNGAQFLATAPLANGIASVNFQTIAGMENILAKYAGDTNFVGSASETVTITAVTPTASTTTLAVSSNSVTKGSIVTLTATVTDIGNPVTQGLVTFCNGTAQFCEDSAVLGKAHLTNSGTATLKLALPVGNNSIKAVFGGTDDVKSSTSSAQTVTVTAPSSIATSTALTLNGTAGDYTLTAAVTGTWPPPMGNVSFVDTSNKNLVLGTKSLSAGIPAFTQSSAATGSYPASIAVADFNGDGKPDVAVANLSSNSLTILLGNGGGTFTAVASPISGTPNFNNPYSIVAGDFNGDGKPDLAVANFAGDSSSLTILLGNGDGTFTVKSTPVVGIAPAAIAVGDFNGDGKLDLAVANENSNNITILLGNGDGTFTADPVSPSTAAYPYALVTADFNGDGKADLAVFGYGSNSVTILLGNGDGTFSPVSASPATGNNPSFMAVLDFNQDGIPDLAVVNSSSNTVTILQGKGDGTFSTAFTLPTGAGPLGIVAADFNGDGTTDHAIATDNGSSLTLLLNYVNRFAPQNVPLTSGSGPLPIAVGDFNLDGSPDLVVGDINLNVAHILLNSATSSASTSGITVPGGGTHEVEAIYAGAPPYLGSISTPVAATGTPISTTVLASAPAATVGQNVAISVSISPTSAANFSVSGTVSLYNGSTLLGTMTLANAQATFSTSFAIAGTYTLTVKYGGNTNFAAGSGTVTVNVRP
ncbi:MAG: VCBS repeat-containing protein, partial [Acidobacteriaceae bacterium]|nr:VCBS repeat-containing protein [Acidobacteriaceae bacterium]